MIVQLSPFGATLFPYDTKEGTRQEIADRFRVSLGMVKKLLLQRRKAGDIRHYMSD